MVMAVCLDRCLSSRPPQAPKPRRQRGYWTRERYPSCFLDKPQRREAGREIGRTLLLKVGKVDTAGRLAFLRASFPMVAAPMVAAEEHFPGSQQRGERFMDGVRKQ
jgi:hypothetical protein